MEVHNQSPKKEPWSVENQDTPVLLYKAECLYMLVNLFINNLCTLQSIKTYYKYSESASSWQCIDI